MRIGGWFFAIFGTLLFFMDSVRGGYEEGANALLAGDFQTALSELTPAANGGDERAQVFLGSMYRNGLGVPKDASLAAHWYRKAAEQGWAPAQVSLGHLYRKGVGVSQDYGEAAKWYRKAADRNLAMAQVSMGAAYSYGHGVPQNYVLAHMWFSLALSGISTRAKDIDLARKGIQQAEARLTPGQIEEAKRLAESWTPTIE